MIHFTRLQLLQALIFCVCLISNFNSQGQVRLKSVYPLIGGNQMNVTWDAVAGAEEYEYRVKENNGAYSAFISTGLNTNVSNNGLNAASTYTYQVRVKIAGVFGAPSNEKQNGFSRVWPVRRASDGVTESREMLHGFGQPIGGDFVGGPLKYFHEGIDIQGQITANNAVVRAPAGGIVLHNGGAGADIYVAIQVSIGGMTRYILFNHLKNNNANLIVGESVAVGDSIGVIADGIWNAFTSHTHCQFYTNEFDFITTALNPFNFWDNDAYRDPQGNNPQVINTNGDADSLMFRKTPNSTDYFPRNGKVHNGVDIVVEAVDKQSTDAPWQNPKIVGYSIQRRENGTWKDAVKTQAAPYVLVDHNIYYESYSGSPNTGRVNTIIDYRDALKGTPPNTPADYAFSQWFTYIVTNTKGTTGAIADLDSNQHWATDARTTVAEDNGYKAGYDKARSIDEAKFPDGKYRTSIHLEDLVHKSPDFMREIFVDNFRPYAKKVEIKAGKLNYMAGWEWDVATGKLALKDNKDTNKASGKVTIRITTSEPMRDVSIEVPSLTFTKNSTTPVANTDAKVWEFEIPANKLDGVSEGPHKILIDGHDSTGNALQGFLTKSDKTGADLQKRMLDSSWSPADAPVKDTIHSFKVDTKVDIEFVIDDTGSMSEEIDGVKNGILQILSLPIFASDTTGWRFQLTTFKDNVTTRPSTSDLNVIKNQVSALFASGGGDCPESSVEAVDAIKDSVKRGGIVFLATDASPHPGLDFTGIAAALKDRGVILSVLLSGDCTGSFLLPTSVKSSAPGSSNNENSADTIPYSDNHDNGAESKPSVAQQNILSPVPGLSPNPTAIEAFSFLAQETGGLFAFVPEVNSGNTADFARYVNIVYNLILGAIAPAITNIEPGKGPVGGTLALTISGSRTNFNSTTTLSFSDTGIVVKELKVLSPTKIQATVVIGSSVPLGFKDIRSNTELGGGITDTAGGKGLFQVTAAPTAPTILSISPTMGAQGQSLSVKVTGINTHFTDASVLSVGNGITVLNVTALNNSELQANIRIESTALIGFRDIRVITGTEVATEAVTGPFLVTAPTSDTSACNLVSLDLGPDKTVNLFYEDSTCATLVLSGLDSSSLGSYSIKWSTGDTTAVIRVCPSSTTQYYITVTRGSCIFNDTVTVQVVRCPGNIIVTAPSCKEKATISWTEPKDYFPASFSAPVALDPSGGSFTYLGSMDGHGYYKSNNSYLWPVARDIAKFIGGTKVNGHLATITSAEENNFVSALANVSSASWIGLFNTGRPGRFRWVTNEDLVYTNWAPGEPNNYGGDKNNVLEPYVSMYKNGAWNDENSVSLPFIMEFEKPVIKYRQISGPENGSAQKTDVYVICYERTNMITDQKDTCCFTVTVTCSPEFTGICPKDTIIYASSCTAKATIGWTEPKDTFPASFSAPEALDPGKGSFTYLGSLDGHGYYKSNNSYLWPVARDVAKLIGGTGVNGNLAIVSSGEENNFINSRIAGAAITPWIGLFNTGRPGRFRWVTNEDLAYTNWSAGEPDNSGGDKNNVLEPYVRMNGNGTWSDVSSVSLPFITEFEKPLIKYRQISGPKNGSSQKTGVYVICYERTNLITDAKDTCCFTIVVTCNPSLVDRAISSPGVIVAEEANALENIAGSGFRARVRPNPSSTQFMIDMFSDNKEKISVQVFDVVGRIIERRDGLTPYQIIKIGSAFKPGVYFVQLTQGTKTIMLKMIKQSH